MQQGWTIYGRIIIGFIGFYFFVMALIGAKSFLIPFTMAILLALVMLPLAKKLEKKRLQRGLAAFISTFVIFGISVGFASLMAYQSKVLVDKWPVIKENMQPKVLQLRQFLAEHTPLSEGDMTPSFDSMMSAEFNPGAMVASWVGSISGFLGNWLLVMIYVFFLLNYRARFRTFVLRIFSREKHENLRYTIATSANIAPQYLTGILTLMGALSVFYSIGLGISGVDNFILISVVAALLTLIPFIGNVLGFTLAMVFGYLTSGDTFVLIGIMFTFGVGQFVESYILQPFVVGDRVKVHPFFTILVVILGNAIWGITGAVLAVPIFGIMTVLLLNIPALRPLGLLFSTCELTVDYGEEEQTEQPPNEDEDLAGLSHSNE
ncbi:MAG: AI-2E family transporter [Aureispira sp.]